MLTGGAPLQLSSLYRTQLTFSRSQTAVGEGQTSCFRFLWNAYSRIVKMEIDQQLEQRINITFLVKLGKNGPCCIRNRIVRSRNVRSDKPSGWFLEGY